MAGLNDILSAFINADTLLAKIQTTLSSGLPGLLPNGIGLSNLAQINNNTLLGNSSGSSGNVSALTLDQIYPMLGLQLPPQGRLTLTSGSPVMTVDVTGATGIYYPPYNGNIMPIYDGTVFNMKVFSQLLMSLSTANNTSGNSYDLFVFANSGTPAIASGPAWTNVTGRSAAITQINGLWVNSGSINLTNGATSYSGISAGQATCVGSFYCPTNGTTSMQFKPAAASGGSNALLGVSNAYNRVKVFASSRDSTASWTYASTTWRAANGSTGNRVTWIDSLGQSAVLAHYTQAVQAGLSGGDIEVGVLFNASSGAPSGKWGTQENNSASIIQNDVLAEDKLTALGLNYAQAVEQNAAGATGTFFGGNFQILTVDIEM